jgi:hypothetical protein
VAALLPVACQPARADFLHATQCNDKQHFRFIDFDIYLKKARYSNVNLFSPAYVLQELGISATQSKTEKTVTGLKY